MLAALSVWQMTGRIGLTSSTEAVSGDIAWQQSGDSYTIGLAGPLGRRLDIEQTPGVATLSASGQGKYSDANGVRWVARIKRYLQVDASGFTELKSAGQIDLPGLIEITGDEYSIRLLVKSWQGLAPDAAEKPSGNGRLAIPGG